MGPQPGSATPFSPPALGPSVAHSWGEEAAPSEMCTLGSLGSPWREQIAVPLLKKNGLNFFNPAVCSSSRLIPIEASAQDNSRSVSAMCQAAYLIGSGCNVVLCLQHIAPDTVLDTGDIASKTAVKDYNRGRSYLSDFANREGVPVFDEIQEALECVISKCKASN